MTGTASRLPDPDPIDPSTLLTLQQRLAIRRAHYQTHARARRQARLGLSLSALLVGAALLLTFATPGAALGALALLVGAVLARP
jgi:hypothetical protein